DNEVAFVQLDELRVNRRDRRRVGLVVIMDQLDLAAEEAAFGVGFLLPNLGAEQRLLAVGRQRTSQRHAEADLDGVAALRTGGDNTSCPRNPSGSDSSVTRAPGDATSHGFLQKVLSSPLKAVSHATLGEPRISVSARCLMNAVSFHHDDRAARSPSA